MENRVSLINKVELHLYSILGVRFFQKMVFNLEKFIHRKDGEKNQNYHFTSNSIEAMDQFVKYLFFNGSIHFRNIVFFIVYCIMKKVFFSFGFYDIFIVILFIKDVYCIMLQRYNYLRIKKANLLMQKRREICICKKVNELLPVFNKEYDVTYAKNDLQLICRIENAVLNKSQVVLTEEDENALKRLIDTIYGK